ncbi:hypothetical protein [Chryseobacterium sp. M5A1_1a]
MREKSLKAIDKALEGKNIDPVLRADLEKKREILSKNKVVKK